MNEASQSGPVRLALGGHWRNWVGNQSFVARHKAEPASEDELAVLVREAARQNLGVRVAGSGHSFTPVVATSGLLLSLKNMQGVAGADLARKRVTVRAGTKIGDIGRALDPRDLALLLDGAKRLHGPGDRHELSTASQRRADTLAGRPGDVLGLQPQAGKARRRLLDELQQGGGQPDLDPHRHRGRLDLFCRLAAVTPVGDQQRLVGQHEQHPCRAREAGQVLDVGQFRYEQAIATELSQARHEARQAAGEVHLGQSCNVATVQHRRRC